MTRPSWLLLAALPLLVAPKCFDPPEDSDAGAGVDASAAAEDAAPTGGDGASATADAMAFVPAVACAHDGEARLMIVDYAYSIRCGCEEATGKTCTVPRGTRVLWQFADAEEHNVASDGDSFGASGERLTGTYVHVFDAPGSYLYGCTIHTEMGGYSIVVL
jgi:hypothetical protein